MGNPPVQLPPAPPPEPPQPNTPSRDPVAHTKPKPSRKLTLRQRAKKIAWRITAIYAWVWLASLLVLGSRTVESLQNTLADRSVQLLSSIGFAPVNGAALPLVFKAGWLL